MPFFLVDDNAHSHPKLLAAGDAAVGLWARAGSYCARYLTEGHVSRQAFRTLGGRVRAADRLVEVGLWVVDPDGDGWRFHQWTEHGNRTKVEVERDRAAAAERKRRQRAREAVDNPVDDAGPAPESGPNSGQNPGQTLGQTPARNRAKVDGIPAGHGVSSRRDSHDPGQARPHHYLLTLVGRLALGSAIDANAGPPPELLEAWRDVAGALVDLDAEARTYLAHYADRPARDERAAWLGWLRRARTRAERDHRPSCQTPGCHAGWLPPVDDRPVPCPTCRPHLRPVPTTEAS